MKNDHTGILTITKYPNSLYLMVTTETDPTVSECKVANWDHTEKPENNLT